MHSLLKALGLTIWSMVALGLLVSFVVVGYRLGLQRHFVFSEDVAREPTALRDPSLSAVPNVSASAKKRAASAEASAAKSVETVRASLRTAFDNGAYFTAIGYGQKLIDRNVATPTDLAAVAQSYVALGNCSAAQDWVAATQQNLRPATLEKNAALARVATCCGGSPAASPAVLDDARRARIDVLLDTTAAAGAPTGDGLLRLGERYYGAGKFDFAIVAIQRALQVGQMAHLDEAYVYLGRAEEAVGDFAAARSAFEQLKNVHDINPRLLMLWTLYAEVKLSPYNSTLEHPTCPAR